MNGDSEDEDSEKKLTPWSWPFQWLKDEKWWRDVSSRAVAGLLIVLVTYALGVASGYLNKPGVGGPLIFLLVGLVVILSMIPTFITRYRRGQISSPPLSVMLLAIAFVSDMALIVVLVVPYYSQTGSFWPF